MVVPTGNVTPDPFSRARIRLYSSQPVRLTHNSIEPSAVSDGIGDIVHPLQRLGEQVQHPGQDRRRIGGAPRRLGRRAQSNLPRGRPGVVAAPRRPARHKLK